MEAIVTAAIPGLISLAGVVLSSFISGQKMAAQLERSQAITDTRLEELTREVREHNHFARRMPVVEEQVKVLSHRIQDLERYHKPS